MRLVVHADVVTLIALGLVLFLILVACAGAIYDAMVNFYKKLVTRFRK